MSRGKWIVLMVLGTMPVTYLWVCCERVLEKREAAAQSSKETAQSWTDWVATQDALPADKQSATVKFGDVTINAKNPEEAKKIAKVNEQRALDVAEHDSSARLAFAYVCRAGEMLVRTLALAFLIGLYLPGFRSQVAWLVVWQLHAIGLLLLVIGITLVSDLFKPIV